MVVKHNYPLASRLLSAIFSPGGLRDILLPRESWHPYPTIEERDQWQTLPAAIKPVMLAQGEAALTHPWPHLPATLYLQYARNGNRRNFEREFFTRRSLLLRMVLAECVEAQGRFMDAIADAIWGICEESSWCFPAHIGVQQAGVGLPDTAEPIVDLFAAETSTLLAWTDYLLGTRLDSVSPLLRSRIRREVDTRILTPALERDDFWWMGFQRLPVNNWNPWVNSNWLASALLLETNPTRRAEAVWKIIESLDCFLVPYPSDGGCDEGPSYWTRAGASLFDNLELLYSATGGKFDIYQDPKVQEIGRFVYRAYIAGDYYVNFADAPARLVPDPLLVYRYGQRIADQDMMAFGAWLGQECQILTNGIVIQPDSNASVMRLLPALFNLENLSAIPPRRPLLRDVWLPEIQVMVARDQSGIESGYYLAAKGGHNEESHNHNDVGHFIVYRDGKPLIIDVGVETYTRKTFSQQRYEIWTMQSAYHSLPTLDGVLQSPGRVYQAQNVAYSEDEASAQLTLDIAGAYPPEAGLQRWQRTITLQRGQGVIIHENWLLNRTVGEIAFSLMTPCTVDTSAPGLVSLSEVLLGDNRLSASGQIQYDPDRLMVSTEEIPVTDPRLQSAWGPRLSRIIFQLSNPPAQSQLDFKIS